MTANLGSFDRLARAVLGIILFFAPLANVPAIWSSATFAYISMIVGVILFATAIFRFCPIYRIFGITTNKV